MMNKYQMLEERCLRFAKNVRSFVGRLPKTIAAVEDGKQLIRSSGSVGANYIEANEALSRKDMMMRLKISRKEAKESLYWLRVLEPPASCELQKNLLMQEAHELVSIFGSVIIKLEHPRLDPRSLDPA